MTMTELLPSIRQLTPAEKLHLIRILAEELDTKDNISPFQPNKIYYLPTPYQSFGTGGKLMASLSDEAKE